MDKHSKSPLKMTSSYVRGVFKCTFYQSVCITVVLCITVCVYYCVHVLLCACITVCMYYCVHVLLCACIAVYMYYCCCETDDQIILCK